MNTHNYKQQKENISKMLLQLQPNVLGLGIINKQGRLEEYVGENFDMNKDKQDMLHMQFALFDSMQKDFDEDFGLMDYAIIMRNNLQFVILPYSENQLLFSVLKRSVDHEKIVPILSTSLMLNSHPLLN